MTAVAAVPGHQGALFGTCWTHSDTEASRLISGVQRTTAGQASRFGTTTSLNDVTAVRRSDHQIRTERGDFLFLLLDPREIVGIHRLGIELVDRSSESAQRLTVLARPREVVAAEPALRRQRGDKTEPG